MLLSHAPRHRVHHLVRRSPVESAAAAAQLTPLCSLTAWIFHLFVHGFGTYARFFRLDWTTWWFVINMAGRLPVSVCPAPVLNPPLSAPHSLTRINRCFSRTGHGR